MVTEQDLSLRDLRLRKGSAQLELNRIRQSTSFRFGILFTRAIQNPLRLLRLPFDLIILAIELIRGGSEIDLPSRELRRSVLLISSGTPSRTERLEQLAKVIRVEDSDVEVVHLTLGINPAHAASEDVIRYTAPDPSHHLSREDAVLTEHLGLLLAAHRPTVVLFDGAFPHHALIRIMEEHPPQHWIWLQPGGNTTSAEAFDAVMVPSELFEDDPDLNHPPAVHPHQKFTSSERADIRQRLGIDPHASAVFCRLPRGPSKKQLGQFRKAIERLADQGAQTFTPSVSFSEEPWSGLRNIRPLPLGLEADWICAFDVAIIDGSYEAVIQFPLLGIPCLIFPKLGGKNGAQERRADALVQAGLAIRLGGEIESIRHAIQILLNPMQRRRLRATAEDIDQIDSAGMEWIVSRIFDAFDAV